MQLGILFIVLGYLLGSISSAIIICRLMGLADPRSTGSNNPGTTNVLRIGGKFPAILTLLFDALKGFIPVLVAVLIGVKHQWLAWIALAAILGHMFPVFFKFKGGKGVATMLGALLGLAWPLGVLVIATWLVVALIFRYSSLAALVATVLAPVYAFYLFDKAYTIPLAIMALIVVIRHHENIRRLVTGQESRIGKKADRTNE